MDPPSLKELALHQCMRVSGYISDLGNTRYELVEPALSRLNSRQLRMIEEQNPHICNKSDVLWRNLIQKDFPESPVPYNDFRNNYANLQAEKDRHLGAARERLLKNQKQAAKARAHTSISITEPVSRSHTTPWRSTTMQQLAKQSSLVSRGRTFPRQSTPALPLWSPAHSPTYGSPSPPIQRCPPPSSPTTTIPKRPLPPTSESDRKRKAKGGIFIRR